MKNIRVQDIPAPKSLEGVDAAIDLCGLKLEPMREGLRAKMKAGEDCGGVNRAIAVWESQLAVYRKMRVIYESPGSTEAFETNEGLKQALRAAEKSASKTKKFMTSVLCEIREALEACPLEVFPPHLEPIRERVRALTRGSYPMNRESVPAIPEEILSDLSPKTGSGT